MHRGLRWVPCFLSIPVAGAMTFPSLQRPPSMMSMFVLTGESVVYSLWPIEFCLYRLALFAIGLSLTCGLVTTLSLAFHCNITIRPESIRCVIVTYGLIFVCQLVTTHKFSIHCNTVIRPKFVRCALVVFR